MEKVSRELSTPEVETFSALLAEQESATINKSFENFFDEAGFKQPEVDPPFSVTLQGVMPNLNSHVTARLQG
jgi:hypothetical protein